MKIPALLDNNSEASAHALYMVCLYPCITDKKKNYKLLL